MIDLGPQIATQEWWSGLGFWLLVGGLICEVLVLALPFKWGWLEKALSGFFTIVIAVGCAFEHVADTRIADLVAKQEADAGVEIARANDRAATAMADAALLGVSQKTLHDFVVRKQREIDQQFGQFKTFATDERVRAEKVISDLSAKRQEISKARDDALQAAKSLDEALTAVKREITAEQASRQPRRLTPQQFNDVVKAVQQAKSTRFDMAVIPNDPEAMDLMQEVSLALKTAGWNWIEFNHPNGPFMTVYSFKGLPNIGQKMTNGIFIGFHSDSQRQFQSAANALADALKKAGLPAHIATSDEWQDVPNKDALHVIVGKKE